MASLCRDLVAFDVFIKAKAEEAVDAKAATEAAASQEPVAKQAVDQHAAKAGASGFSDTKITATQFRVTFQGDNTTSRYEVEDFLLFRAAELTTEQGFDYFVISERDVEAEINVVTTRRPAFYSRYDHAHEHRNYNFPYYAYGYDWGYPHDTETREYTKYSAVAYIDMHSGQKPENTDQTFNALEIIATLGPVDCWKPQPHDEKDCKLAH